MPLFNTVRFLLGILLIVIAPAFILWGRSKLGNHNLDTAQWISITTAFLCYTLHQYTLYLMTRFPGNRSSISILPSIALWYGLFISFIMMFRFDYSVVYISISLLLNICFSFLVFILKKRLNNEVMAYVPVGKTHDLSLIPNVQWIKVNRPRDLNTKAIKAIVADLHAPDLDHEWQKFLADQTLNGTLVYNVKQVVESMTGRIKINHMYENNLGSLLPSPGYMMVKQLFDICLVL